MNTCNMGGGAVCILIIIWFLHIHEQSPGVFYAWFDFLQECDSLPAVNQTMIVGQG